MHQKAPLKIFWDIDSYPCSEFHINGGPLAHQVPWFVETSRYATDERYAKLYSL